MKTIGNVLALVFDKDVLKKALGQSKLQAEWDGIIEETFLTKKNRSSNCYDDAMLNEYRITAQKVACHSKIAYIKNNILFVEIDHQGWMQILQTVQKKIITVINKKYPDISLNSIAFLLANDAERTTQTENSKDVLKTGDMTGIDKFVQNGGGENRYEKIKDERLKKILKQLEQRVNMGENE
jgi:hypothetical protein